MRKRRHPFYLQVTLPVLILTIICAGIYLSFLTHDPHWLNRAGALVAAVAASAILVQISTEIRLEHEREIIDACIHKTAENNCVVTPINKLANRLAINKLQVERSQISDHRLQVAMFVVIAAMIGEVLHGFGDLIMCYVFGVCVGY